MSRDPCQRKGIKKSQKIKDLKEDTIFIFPSHKLSPNMSFAPDFVLSSKHRAMNKSSCPLRHHNLVKGAKKLRIGLEFL